MQVTPLYGPRVLRAPHMPYRVTMWVDHTPRGDVVYVDKDEMSQTQAQQLQRALRDGSMTIDELIDAARE
jgi:hypothetical protein